MQYEQSSLHGRGLEVVVQSYGTQSNLKKGLKRPLMREVLDKLDECDGRLSELLIDSATDESEANFPIKMTPQEDHEEVVYLSRTRKGTMRSKMVIDRINEMEMKLGSKVTLGKAGKTREILSQCGESILQDFKSSPLNHGNGSNIGQLVPVKYNRLKVSETVSIDEPAGGYTEMLEYRKSARGHLIALKNKRSMEGYLETMMQGTTLKQKANGTLIFSEMHAENNRAIGDSTMESSSGTVLRSRNENHSKDTRSDSDILCETRITT